MKLTQLLEALDKRGVGEALMRGGEPLQMRIEGDWRPQGAAIPIGALSAMLEKDAPADAVSQWQNENRCQFEQSGFLVKAARKDDRVQIAVKRANSATAQATTAASAQATAVASTSPFTATTDPAQQTQTVFAPTSNGQPKAQAKGAAPLKPAVIDWYYLDNGTEAGPVAPDRVRALIGAGTIDGDTLVWSDGMSDWLPARDSDLRGMLPASALARSNAAPATGGAAPIAAPDASGGDTKPTRTHSTPFTISRTGEEVEYEEQRSKGANWFYWIVGLTVINTLVAQTGMDIGFMLGSTATMAANDLTQGGSSAARAGALAFSVFVIAFYAMCGVMGSRGATWAFVLGLIAFTLDSLLLLLGLLIVGFGIGGLSSLFSIALHGYALYCIFNGLMASVNYHRLMRENARTGMPVA